MTVFGRSGSGFTAASRCWSDLPADFSQSHHAASTATPHGAASTATPCSVHSHTTPHPQRPQPHRATSTASTAVTASVCTPVCLLHAHVHNVRVFVLSCVGNQSGAYQPNKVSAVIPGQRGRDWLSWGRVCTGAGVGLLYTASAAIPCPRGGCAVVRRIAQR